MWVAFAFTGFSAAVLITLSYIRNVKAEARLVRALPPPPSHTYLHSFHLAVSIFYVALSQMYYLCALLCTITAFCYLMQAMGGVQQQTRAWIYNGVATLAITNLNNQARGFQWLRYVAWAFSAPITIVLLGHLSGAHWVEIVWVSLCTLISVASLYGATVSGGYNAVWPVFAFGCLFGLPVIVGLLYIFRVSAYRVHTEIGRLYDVLGFSLAILCVGYAITWGVSEGGYYTTQEQEIIIYATFDSLTKGTFCFALIYARESIARYGSFIGINTGVDFDFPIAKSTYTSSAQGYAEEPKTQVVMGESRDLAFAQLHAATNTAAPVTNVNWWPETDVPGSQRKQL